MKSIALLLCLSSSLLAAIPHRRVADYYGSDNISALNYSLSRALQPNASTTGIVLDATPVLVTSYRRGILPLLFTGIADTFVGTRSSEVQSNAMQYSVRLDTPYQRDFKIITVVQAPDVQIKVNSPVLVISDAISHTEHHCTYSVRLSPYTNPDTINTPGVQEQAHAKREQQIKADTRR